MAPIPLSNTSNARPLPHSKNNLLKSDRKPLPYYWVWSIIHKRLISPSLSKRLVNCRSSPVRNKGNESPFENGPDLIKLHLAFRIGIKKAGFRYLSNGVLGFKLYWPEFTERRFHRQKSMPDYPPPDTPQEWVQRASRPP